MGRRFYSRSKISRRLGEKLPLKGERDLSAKHAYTRRSYPPGKHGPKGYPRLTEYGTQLREKQKLRALFHVMERQFANYVNQATKYKGVTGEKLLELLERRIDNVIFRSRLATSRVQARQLVSHGHVSVNGTRVTVPSLQVAPGDVFEVRARSKTSPFFKERVSAVQSLHLEPPSWITFDYESMKGKIDRIPAPEELEQGIDTRLIVEYYSR